MGTPAFARDVLDAVLAAPGHQVVAVYTQPARPGGRRGRELVKSPVQLRAEEAGLPVYDPVSLKGAEAQATFAALDADVAVVAAYGLLLPRAIPRRERIGDVCDRPLPPPDQRQAPDHRSHLMMQERSRRRPYRDSIAIPLDG